jgi:hypothetical protein
VHAIIEMHEGEPLLDKPSQPPVGAASADDSANGDHADAVREEHMLPGL